MSHRALTVGFLAMLTVIVTGCPLTKSLDAERHPDLSRAKSVDVDGGTTLDDLFVKIAQRVPAFGGMFFSDNQLYVYLVDLTQKTNVAAAIIDVMTPYRPDLEQVIRERGFRVLQGKYGFLQLKEWHDRMRAEVLAIPGVTMTDIDEVRNRLRVGVEKVQLASAVEQKLTELGIPREAVIIEETGPIEVVPVSQRDS